MKLLITGVAGFIGYHLAKKILEKKNVNVLGLDNINNYYDPRLKKSRLADLGILKKDIKNKKMVLSKTNDRFRFIKMDLQDKLGIIDLFKQEQFTHVCHLAAQAGVRYSLINPQAYLDSNIQGFFNILEAIRICPVKHFCYASSSSVYGLNESVPFSVRDNVDHPISLYAASKKSNELMAHAYSSLFKMPTTGLRFFTVYGPWGRPDMALFLFVKKMLDGEDIQIFNRGKMERDFTYIDDIVQAVIKVLAKPPKPNKKWSGVSPDPSSSIAPYKLYNVGNHAPVSLMHFLSIIEKKLSIKAKKKYLGMQPGEVTKTFADAKDLYLDIDFKPETPIERGIGQFVDWYLEHYKI